MTFYETYNDHPKTQPRRTKMSLIEIKLVEHPLRQQIIDKGITL
jgi:hypothetical protein